MSPADLLALPETMWVIRAFEEKVSELYARPQAPSARVQFTPAPEKPFLSGAEWVLEAARRAVCRAGA